MKLYTYELPTLAGIRGQLKKQVKADQLEVPCRLLAIVPRLKYGKYPVEYRFDFLTEEGHGSCGLVAHELDMKVVEVELEGKSSVLDQFTDEELLDALYERLKKSQQPA